MPPNTMGNWLEDGRMRSLTTLYRHGANFHLFRARMRQKAGMFPSVSAFPETSINTISGPNGRTQGIRRGSWRLGLHRDRRVHDLYPLLLTGADAHEAHHQRAIPER